MSLYRTSGVFKSTLLKVAAVLENFPWTGAGGGERPASDPCSRNTDADGGSRQPSCDFRDGAPALSRGIWLIW